MISNILAYLYAASLVFSSCFFTFAEKRMPVWLFILNITAAVVVSLEPISINWLLFGLILALVVAPLNGKIVLGRIHLRHFLARLIFSIFLILLAYKRF